MTTFGQNLQHYREKANINRLALAGITGVHYSHLSKIENDLQTPNLDTVLKIAKGLGITGSELLQGLVAKD